MIHIFNKISTKNQFRYKINEI